MSDYSDYKLVVPIQIRFNDLDGLNHVNNAVYLTYIETARVTYFYSVLGINMEDTELNMILASVKIDYKAPVLLADNISIYGRCTKMGNKSFDLEFLVVKHVGDEKTIMAVCTNVVVAYNYKQGKAIELLPQWRERINNFENGL